MYLSYSDEDIAAVPHSLSKFHTPGRKCVCVCVRFGQSCGCGELQPFCVKLQLLQICATECVIPAMTQMQECVCVCERM